jgi:hypothetical protein
VGRVLGRDVSFPLGRDKGGLKMNIKIAHARSIKQTLRQIALSIALLLALSSLATSIAHANPLNSPPAQGSQPDYTGQSIFILCILVWIGLAIWGIAKIIQKGYLSGIGCGVWAVVILFGWWSIPIILGLGPIWLGIAAMLETKSLF